MLFDIMPSFLVSYALYAISAFKVHIEVEIFNLVCPSQIRSKLFALGSSISERTKQMQLRFFLTQIAQVYSERHISSQ